MISLSEVFSHKYPALKGYIHALSSVFTIEMLSTYRPLRTLRDLPCQHSRASSDRLGSPVCNLCFEYIDLRRSSAYKGAIGVLRSRMILSRASTP